MTTTTLKATASARQTGRAVRNAVGGRVMAVSLADPQIQIRVSALEARVTLDSASSKKFLKSVGIMNKSGKTSKNFGG
jgi:hypothetical protein